MVPGSALLFWSLSSLFDSMGTFALTNHWEHPTGERVAALMPLATQQWLADPYSWLGAHAIVSKIVALPLSALLAVPGGVLVFAGLCFWEEARQEALEEHEGTGGSPLLRTASRLARRRG